MLFTFLRFPLFSFWCSLPTLSRASDIAFGDVSADGEYSLRFMENPAADADGMDYDANPMASHDWSHVGIVRKSLDAQLRLARNAGQRISTLEAKLKPMYAALPKSSQGALDMAASRYAMHRYFAQDRGWFVKGLQPAGASWTSNMSITQDVVDITKYIVPTYLQVQMVSQSEFSGIGLRDLAILVATMEHLIRGEMMELLYAAYRVLKLPIAGKRLVADVDRILDVFMLAYAFGGNLDTTSTAGLTRDVEILSKYHPGWMELQKFVVRAARLAVQKELNVHEFNFAAVMQMVDVIQQQYGPWQSRDCTRAKSILQSRGGKTGRAPWLEMQPSTKRGARTLFNESIEYLQFIGVLDESDPKQPQLLEANFLNSPLMCLATGSFYTVCCPNECETLLTHLETSIAAPEAAIDTLIQSLMAYPSFVAHPLPHDLWEDLEKSVTYDGKVKLHSREFAHWLHRALPSECPKPHSAGRAAPKTPDEWMGDPGTLFQDTEEMMEELAAITGRFVAFDEDVIDIIDAAGGEADLVDEDRPWDSGGEVVDMDTSRPGDKVRIKGGVSSLLKHVFQVASVLSMLLMFASSIRSALASVRGGAGKAGGTDKLAYMA